MINYPTPRSAAEMRKQKQQTVTWILEERKRRREQALFEIRAVIAQRERRERDEKG